MKKKPLAILLLLSSPMFALGGTYPVKNCDSERISFFVETNDEEEEPKLRYRFDGGPFHDLPDFSADWSWNHENPADAIHRVSFCPGGRYFFVVYRAGRITVGEALYEVDYHTKKIRGRGNDLHKFIKDTRAEKDLETPPRGPNTSGEAFIAWVDHDTFILEIRSGTSRHHVYSRMDVPRRSFTDTKAYPITKVAILKYDREAP